MSWSPLSELRAWIRAELSPPAAPARRAVPPFPSFRERRDHVYRRYERLNDEDHDSRALLLWSWSDTERTQVVDLFTHTVEDEPWVVIASDFAPTAAVSLEAAVARASECACSFLQTRERHRLAIRLPLDTLRPARLEAVLGLVAREADDAEQDLLGTDEF